MFTIETLASTNESVYKNGNKPVTPTTLRSYLYYNPNPNSLGRSTDPNWKDPKFGYGDFFKVIKGDANTFLWVPNRIAEFLVVDSDDLPYFFVFEGKGSADAYVRRYAAPAAVKAPSDNNANTNNNASTSSGTTGTSNTDSKSDSKKPPLEVAPENGLRNCLYYVRRSPDGQITALESLAYAAASSGTAGDGRMRADSDDEGTYEWGYLNTGYIYYQGLSVRLELEGSPLIPTSTPALHTPKQPVQSGEDLIYYNEDAAHSQDRHRPERNTEAEKQS
jgi:hypothetical protein